MSTPGTLSADEHRLAELGYKQELSRTWSGFQNFAISFTIISILAGCFTTYGQAWNNGGPVAISIGWPLISIPILIIGFCMSELVSAYPTAGGIYWWASKLGGAGWGWFTGWFNLIGLIAVTASVDYGCSLFLNSTLGLYNVDWFNGTASSATDFLHGTFFLFLIVLALHATINIAGSHLVARINGVSVWWHVAGVLAILIVLIAVPAHHQSFSFVFGKRFNNSGFNLNMYWFYILPLGFLLTQYTITGFDSCAHISEETHGASESAAKGVWRSIFYSAIFGWIVLLALTFAATHVGEINKQAAAGQYVSIAILNTAMSTAWVKFVLIISTVGQFFCGAACLTSASRMCYAFSRDGAIPGWRVWSKVNVRRVPSYAVIFMAVLAGLITVPAYFPSRKGEAIEPVAFYAVVSITVIGLYTAYVIPIFLRWKMGDAFQQGPWNLGKKWKWMGLFSTVWVGLITIDFILPLSPGGVPWDSKFDWSLVNYAPLVMGGATLVVGIWWILRARHTFTGPRHTISELDTELGGVVPAQSP
jgi:amino acid transporter